MRRAHEIGWLFIGVLLVFVSHVRWPVHALAWVAPIPWLLVLRARHAREAASRSGALRLRLALIGLLLVAWTAATAKIVSPPLTGMMAVLFGVPIGLLHVAPFLVWDRAAARGRDGLAVIAFVFLPWLDRSPVKSTRYRGWIWKLALAVFTVSFLALMYLGLMPAEGRYVTLARIFTTAYFAFFVLMPFYTRIDPVKAVPERVTYHA